MNDILEGRLRARAADLADAPALSDPARASIRAAVAALARREARARRRGALLALAALAAAIVVLLWWPRAASHGTPTPAQVALLDLSGRPLASRVRAPGEARAIPAEILVEIVGAPGTHAALVLYDDGVRAREPLFGRLDDEGEWTLRVALTGALTVAVLNSTAPIEAADAPMRFDEVALAACAARVGAALAIRRVE